MASLQGCLSSHLAASVKASRSICRLFQKNFRPLGDVLVPVAQAKIVKDAVEAVLMKVKQSQHLIMLSPFEQRMSCLTHIARYEFPVDMIAVILAFAF